MATCRYCGRSAGLFASTHKECEAKHAAGVEELRRLLARYCRQQATAAEVRQTTARLRRENYLAADDIAAEAGATIDEYTATIQRPFAVQVMATAAQLVSAFGEPYGVIDSTGAITRLAQKVVKGHIADYFTGKQDIAATRAAIGQVTSVLPVGDEALQEALYYMLGKAADNYLKDGLITPQEEQRVSTYTAAFGIQVAQLPAAYRSGNIARLSQSTLLANLQRGVLPQRNQFAPVMLGKGETILWQYSDVKLLEEKVQREYHSNRGGVSIRIAKGIYYRPSTGRMKPVEHSYMNQEGIGDLYITNKHLIFNSPTRGVKIPYSKIIGITPYSDGLEVNRDGNAKRIILQGFDSWFIVNVMSMVANT